MVSHHMVIDKMASNDRKTNIYYVLGHYFKALKFKIIPHNAMNGCGRSVR